MISNKNWVLQIDSAVFKVLQKMPRKEVKRLLAVIERLPLNPFSGDIQKMKGEENVWRRRVGSYRIFYELILKERIIYVYQIERRTSTTYRNR
jgi:mRNA interferase RelE/StbE